MFSLPEIVNGEVRKGSLSIRALAAAASIGNILQQHDVLGFSDERLTMRLHCMLITKLLRLKMGFFDVTEISSRALTTLFSSDADVVKGLIGDLFGGGIYVISALLCAITTVFIE